MNFSDMQYTQFLKTISDRINSSMDDASSQGLNDLLQIFEAPYDNLTFSPVALGWVSGTTISTTPNETLTFTVAATPTVTDPSTIVWGDANTDAHWVWGAEAVWG